MALAECLVHRGAKNIVVFTYFKDDLHRRTQVLHKYFDTNFTIIPCDEMSKNVTKFVEGFNIESVEALFLMPTETSTENQEVALNALKLLDESLKQQAPLAVLVNFNLHAAELCQIRRNTGYKSFNVQWSDLDSFHNVLKVLDNILNSNCTHSVLRNKPNYFTPVTGKFYEKYKII